MYSLYKPLRNKIRKYNAYAGLEAIYFIFQHLQFGYELPHWLRYSRYRFRSKLEIGVFEWELSTLAREFLLNGELNSGQKIGGWNEIIELITIIRNIENESWGRFSAPGDIEAEMHRIAHRQFPWQTKSWYNVVGRYYKIFTNDRLGALLSEKFEMSVSDYFQIIVGIVSLFLEKHRISAPIKNTINGVDDEAVAKFIAGVSLDMQEHRLSTKAMQNFGIDWIYSRNSLDEMPIITGTGKYLCVCPAQLMRRLTEGVYFDLVGHRDFANSFGRAFEQYVGDVVRRADTEGKYRLMGSKPYGPRSAKKEGADWIIGDESATVFVECKAGRIRSHLKTEMASKYNFFEAVSMLAKYITQLYVTLFDALNGRYGYWINDEKPLYPLVVTLDDWNYVALNLRSEVRDAVKSNISAHEIPVDIIEKYPYNVCSIDEFENFIQIAQKTGLERLLSLKSDSEHISWSMGPFLLLPEFSGPRRGVTTLFDWEFMRRV